MMHPGRVRRLALFVTVVAAAACATNPATGLREFSLMSEAQEIALGRESDAQIREEMGVYDDPELQRYVSGIGLRLAKLSERPALPWQFTVVDQPAINAFALPGGFIYITRGILPYLDNEAELAGVLGHEIGHVTARHSVQQMSAATAAGVGATLLEIFVPVLRNQAGDAAINALGNVLLSGYGRDHELEADRLGEALCGGLFIHREYRHGTYTATMTVQAFGGDMYQGSVTFTR